MNEILERSTGKLTVEERLANVLTALTGDYRDLYRDDVGLEEEVFAENVRYCIDALEDVLEVLEC